MQGACAVSGVGLTVAGPSPPVSPSPVVHSSGHGKASLPTQAPAPADAGGVDDGVVGDDGAPQPDDGPGHVLSRRIPAHGNGKSRGNTAVDAGCDVRAR